MSGYFCECKKEFSGYYSWCSSLECKEHQTCYLIIKNELNSMRLRLENGYIFYNRSNNQIILQYFNFDHSSFIEEVVLEKHYEFTTVENLREYLIKLSENLVFF